MQRWYSSDQHFAHHNIIEYCGRPFADVNEMNAALVNRWNEIVAPDDEVWVLGDVAMGKVDNSLTVWVSQLAGRKILVPGNHDHCWVGHKKAQESRRAYYQLGGFAGIAQDPDPHEIAGESVRLCHFPYAKDYKGRDKYDAYRPEDDGGWLLHGHVHERWRQDGRQINVGVDVWNFRPVAESEIAELIKTGPASLPALPF